MRKSRFFGLVLFSMSFLLLLAYPKSGKQERALPQSLRRIPGDIERSCDNRAGDLYWVRTYGTSEEDWGNTILPTPDGGFICAGHTWKYQSGFYSGRADTLMLKLDPAGEIEWKKIYRGESVGNNPFWRSYMWIVEVSAIPTRDGGYIVASETSPSGTDNANIWILKLFPNGDIEWQKSYETFGTERVRGCIQTTNDGGYILAGEATETLSRSILVLKLDSQGNLEWQRAYGDFGTDLYDAYATSIYPTSDGGYILGGNISCGSDCFSSWAAKLTNKGDIEWQKFFTYSARVYEGGPILRPTRDGGFIAADFTEKSGTGQPNFGQPDFLIMKLFPDGTIQWQKLIGVPNYSEFPPHSVRETRDGCFVITGFTNFGIGDHRTDCFKLNQSGQLVWQKQLGNFKNILFGLQELGDGNLMMTGYLSPTPYNEDFDICVMKLNPDGNGLPCSLMQSAELTIRDASFIPQDTFVVPRSIQFVTRDTTVVPEDVPLQTELVCWNLNQPAQNVSCTQESNRSLFRKETFNRIRWEANPLNSQFTVVEYRVYRAENIPRSYHLIATVSPGKLECLDGPVKTGDRLYYAVSSVDSAGRESPKSLPVLIID